MRRDNLFQLDPDLLEQVYTLLVEDRSLTKQAVQEALHEQLKKLKAKRTMRRAAFQKPLFLEEDYEDEEPKIAAVLVY